MRERLHRISDQIGENIYENMMTGIERQEKTRGKAEALTEEVKARRGYESHRRGA